MASVRGCSDLGMQENITYLVLWNQCFLGHSVTFLWIMVPPLKAKFPIYSFIQLTFLKPYCVCVRFSSRWSWYRHGPVTTPNASSWVWVGRTSVRTQANHSLCSVLNHPWNIPNKASLSFSLYRQANPGSTGRCPDQGHTESRVELG